LAHDALVLFDFALTHGEVQDQYAAGPRQIGIRNQGSAANARLAASGNPTAEQCAGKHANPVRHQVISPLSETWLFVQDFGAAPQVARSATRRFEATGLRHSTPRHYLEEVKEETVFC
jgi:hypothetical protein